MQAAAAPELIPKGLGLEHLAVDRRRLSIRLRSSAPEARCPVCGRASPMVHSRYSRTIADLPRHGTPVLLTVRARRFFCEEPSCERKIFCERLPDVAATSDPNTRGAGGPPVKVS